MMTLKIAFSGEENTGKTTLSTWLAKELNFIYFPEFARQILSERPKMEPLEWNLWVLELYKKTYELLRNKSFVADRPITDVYAYISALTDSEEVLRFDYLRYQYDVLIVLEKPLEKTQDKDHVIWVDGQEEKILMSLKKYEKILEKKGTLIVRINSDDLEKKKKIIMAFLEGYIKGVKNG